MDRETILSFAEKIIEGEAPGVDQYRALLDTPDKDALVLAEGADRIRDHFFGKNIHLCTICNGKSGKCSEDCAFCAQSVFHKTDAPCYPLLKKERLKEIGVYASETAINRFSVVTSGRGLPYGEVGAVADALGELDLSKISTCASLGILDKASLHRLKEAGVTRVHHNLETAKSFYMNVCTTHSFTQRVETVLAARETGLSVCSGGIFGMGETDEQVLELALTLKDLDVESIPINFLVPVKGTPMEEGRGLTPMRCLRIIALFRFVLPDREIIICGGREHNLNTLHDRIFYAGASG
ncbi:MAG: biotin synthase BioB, partial [Pseudomonadota bacterium]